MNRRPQLSSGHFKRVRHNSKHQSAPLVMLTTNHNCCSAEHLLLFTVLCRPSRDHCFYFLTLAWTIGTAIVTHFAHAAVFLPLLESVRLQCSCPFCHSTTTPHLAATTAGIAVMLIKQHLLHSCFESQCHVSAIANAAVLLLILWPVPLIILLPMLSILLVAIMLLLLLYAVARGTDVQSICSPKQMSC